MRSAGLPAPLAILMIGALGGCVEIPFDAPAGARSGEGSATIEPARVEASEEVRFRIVWTAGGSGLSIGGGFRIELPVDPVHPYLGFTPPQTTHRFRRGHVLCAAMRGERFLARGEARARGGEVRCLLPSGNLEAGDQLVMEYWGLVPRVAGRWPLKMESRWSGGTGGAPIGKSPEVEVDARPARALHAVLPSAATAGDPMTLAVVALDEFGNLADDYEGTVDVELDDARLEHRFTPEDRGVALLPGLAVEHPGFFRALVRERQSPDGPPLLARSNPVKIDVDPPEPILWGDLHFHTGTGAEARGFVPAGMASGDHRGNSTRLEEAYAYARDVMRLDFAAATEHAGGLKDREGWAMIVRATREADDPPRFTAIEGVQWGDRLVLFRSAPERLPRASRLPPEVAAIPGAVLVSLRGAPGRSVVHAAEIYSWRNRGTGYEDRPRALEPDRSWGDPGARPPASFVAGSDNHWGHPGSIDIGGQEPGSGGLTAVAGAPNEKGAILDALRAGRSWATTGARIHLGVIREGGALRVAAAGTAPFASLDLVVVDRRGVRQTPAGPAGSDLFQAAVPIPAAERPAFCFVRATQRDGEIAWSSPIVLPEEP